MLTGILTNGIFDFLTDPIIEREVETYIPLVQQGRGAEVL